MNLIPIVVAARIICMDVGDQTHACAEKVEACIREEYSSDVMPFSEVERKKEECTESN